MCGPHTGCKVLRAQRAEVPLGLCRVGGGGGGGVLGHCWASVSSYGKWDGDSDILKAGWPTDGPGQVSPSVLSSVGPGPSRPVTFGDGRQSSAYRLPLAFAKTIKPKILQNRTLHLCRHRELWRASVHPASWGPLWRGRMWGSRHGRGTRPYHGAHGSGSQRARGLRVTSMEYWDVRRRGAHSPRECV